MIVSCTSMYDRYNGVRDFLCRLGQGHHWNIFKVRGYDREADVVHLNAEDLDNMHITGQDRDIILAAAASFEVTPTFKLQCWLEEHGLGYYYVNMREYDVTDLRQLEHLELNDEVFAELEMDVPGHRKRLVKAVCQLRKRRRVSEPENPVTHGYWGKPPALDYAKNDFLCVKASLRSTKDSSTPITLDFMVDSGSDVVTVREEVLETLDLELIGTIQSRGVHSTKEKLLYKCIVNIGGVDVETEVMSETYDSIGNQILRNFRHYIDSQRHVWLNSEPRFLPPSYSEGQLSPSIPQQTDTGSNIGHLRPPPEDQGEHGQDLTTGSTSYTEAEAVTPTPSTSAS